MAPTSTLIKYVLSVLLSPVCVCGSVGRCSSALCVLSLLLYRLNLRGTLGSIFLTTGAQQLALNPRPDHLDHVAVFCAIIFLPADGLFNKQCELLVCHVCSDSLLLRWSFFLSIVASVQTHTHAPLHAPPSHFHFRYDQACCAAREILKLFELAMVVKYVLTDLHEVL